MMQLVCKNLMKKLIIIKYMKYFCIFIIFFVQKAYICQRNTEFMGSV